jgi:peptidylprolyl isomerase domain and WD repeat-containing protein 1
VQEDCVFVKRFRSHKTAVTCLELSPTGDLCVTMCRDGTVKVYDISAFDMIVMLRLKFVPGCCTFLAAPKAVKQRLAIAEEGSQRIHIFEVGGGEDEISVLEELHQAPVTAMKANAAHGTVRSPGIFRIMFSGSTQY